MRKVVARKLGQSSEVGTLLLKVLVDLHCPVTWSIGAKTATHCFSCETWSTRSAQVEERNIEPKDSTTESPHLPSSTRNSLAMVSGDGAWFIRASSKRCAGTLNADFSTPTRVAIPRGRISADACSLISCKSARGYGASESIFDCVYLHASRHTIQNYFLLFVHRCLYNTTRPQAATIMGRVMQIDPEVQIFQLSCCFLDQAAREKRIARESCLTVLQTVLHYWRCNDVRWKKLTLCKLRVQKHCKQK